MIEEYTIFNFISDVGAPITRIKTMNNDMIKIDLSVSSALELNPDLDRVARAENFVEDGTIDARRD